MAQPALSEAHHKGLLSSLNLGVRYSSILAKRGIVFYRDFQIDPVLGVFLFDDRVEYLGDSLGFRDFVLEKKIRLRTKISAISDNPLFPDKSSVKEGMPDRRDSYELSGSMELFLPGYDETYRAELDLSYAKDLMVHFGHYIEAVAKVKVASFSLGSEVEPNIAAQLGWGDVRHNQYFYGSDADSAGINNVSMGLWCAFPNEADRNFPIVQLMWFSVLGDRNRQAAFAHNRSEGVLLSFIATAGVLE